MRGTKLAFLHLSKSLLQIRWDNRTRTETQIKNPIALIVGSRATTNTVRIAATFGENRQVLSAKIIGNAQGGVITTADIEVTKSIRKSRSVRQHQVIGQFIRRPGLGHQKSPTPLSRKQCAPIPPSSRQSTFRPFLRWRPSIPHWLES